MTARAGAGAHPRAAGAALPGAVLLGSHLAAYGAVRSLSRLDIPIAVVGEDRGVAGRSRHVRAFLRLLPEDPAFVPRLSDWASQILDGRAVILVAGSDAYLDAVAKARDALPPGLTLAGSGWSHVQWLRQKHRCYPFAEELGIPVPKTCYITSRAELETLVDREELPPFPVLLKSEQSQRMLRVHGVKAVLCTTIDEILAAYDRYDGFCSELLLQEMIPGPERGQPNVLTVTAATGEPLAVFVNEKLRTSRRFLSCTLMRSMQCEEAVDMTLHLLRAIGFHGAANAEFKRDPRDGKLKLLEVNARLTVSNSHALRCGVDIVGAAYHLAVTPERRQPTAFSAPPTGILWWYPAGDLAGLARAVFERRACPLQWARDTMGPGYILEPWSCRDPGPGLWSLARALTRRRRGRG